MWEEGRPEAEAASPSASPRLRQTRLTAAPSLGQPRPASASLSQWASIFQLASHTARAPHT